MMEQIRSDLLDDYNQYFTNAVAGTPEDETPPPPPASVSDLQPIAKKYNLEYSVTEEATVLELRETVLGKTYDESRSSSNSPLLNLLFPRDLRNEIDDYEPLIARSFDSFDWFLVQRTADLPAETPELADVRNQVVAAWKQQKAAELALEAAKKYAEQAKTDAIDLKNLFRGPQFSGGKKVEVVETNAFSRMSVGIPNARTRQVPLEISQPTSIVAAGPDFLDAVFELEGADVTAVLNNDESIAYIVRIVRHTDSTEQLRQEFLREGGIWYGQPTMDQARRAEIGAAFVSDLIGEDGLDWKREPDARR